jgi:Rps23 Pro-64 3,4-dihydroxylase Tpa1-like proline 4-hydroxylase
MNAQEIQMVLNDHHALNSLNILEIKNNLKNNPFKHIVIDGLWDDEFLSRVEKEVDKQQKWDGEKNFYGAKQKRFLSDWNKMGPFQREILSILNQPIFLEISGYLLGESALISDPYLEGGGIHSTGENGFLNLHIDFNWNSKLKLIRRVNVLVYLNKDWDPAWGGQLELCNESFQNKIEIEPLFNRTILFITDKKSFHGQPKPIQTKNSMIRRNSIAAYYYQAPSINFLNMHERREGTSYFNLSGLPMNDPRNFFLRSLLKIKKVFKYD